MNKVFSKRKNGYTLLEILIVIAILAIIGILSFQPLLSYYRNVRFQGAVENVLTMLDEARKSTLSSYESSQYGVYFEPQRIVLFKGATFSEPNPDNDEYLLESIITVSTTSFSGGGDSVVFDRISGETSNYGTLGVSIFTGATTTKIITIHPSGLVEVD